MKHEITILDKAELIRRYSNEEYALAINDIILVDDEEIDELDEEITIDDISFDGENAELLRELKIFEEDEEDCYTYEELYGVATTGWNGSRMVW